MENERGRVGEWEGAREANNEDREIECLWRKRAEKAPRRSDRGGGAESNAERGRGRPWATRRGKARGQAERRDEKLDLQICPDYYEIARLPSRDSQPGRAFRSVSVTGYKYREDWSSSSSAVLQFSFLLFASFSSPRCYPPSTCQRRDALVERNRLRSAANGCILQRVPSAQQVYRLNLKRIPK